MFLLVHIGVYYAAICAKKFEISNRHALFQRYLLQNIILLQTKFSGSSDDLTIFQNSSVTNPEL